MLKFRQYLKEDKDAQDVHDENGKFLGRIRKVEPGKWRTEHVDPNRKPITATSLNAAKAYILPYTGESQ